MKAATKFSFPIPDGKKEYVVMFSVCGKEFYFIMIEGVTMFVIVLIFQKSKKKHEDDQQIYRREFPDIGNNYYKGLKDVFRKVMNDYIPYDDSMHIGPAIETLATGFSSKRPVSKVLLRASFWREFLYAMGITPREKMRYIGNRNSFGAKKQNELVFSWNRIFSPPSSL